MAGPSAILTAVYRRDTTTLARPLARAEPAALARRSPDGWPPPPLHIAAFHDDVALVTTLLAHGADAGAPTDDGRTALAIAEAPGQALVVRRLRGELP
jgi:ankyrin repeat protein